MTNTNITALRQNLFGYADSCIKYNDIVNISTKDGNVVMMSEDEYNGLIATLELSSVPGMKESILEGMNTPREELEEFTWNE